MSLMEGLEQIGESTQQGCLVEAHLTKDKARPTKMWSPDIKARPTKMRLVKLQRYMTMDETWRHMTKGEANEILYAT